MSPPIPIRASNVNYKHFLLFYIPLSLPRLHKENAEMTTSMLALFTGIKNRAAGLELSFLACCVREDER